MSLLSILFGCNTKKKSTSIPEWPRFPATDKSEITVTAITLADSFNVVSFYISPDKQNMYVLGSRAPQESIGQENGENRPGDPDYMDYRLLCLDANGQTKYHKDFLKTDWMYGGNFGLLHGDWMLRIGDCFLVLEPTTFAVKEKIHIHDSKYIPWKNKVMTRDEYESDYKSKFDAALENCKTCKFLDWSPGREYMIFIQGAAGKRSAWTPMSYEENDLAELKQRFENLSVTLYPKVLNEDRVADYEITDEGAHIQEVEYLSGGTQLDYPNYKSRSVLQYELSMNNEKVHFSTTDKDRHNLRLSYSDNLMLSMADGSVWVMYEDILYRIHKN
jgi:hypothetical protein